MRNKATIHVVWNDYKGASTKKNLKLRVTFGGKPRLYATNSDEEFTEQEFKTLKKKVERGKGEYPKSVTKAVETATRIINQLGADFSFDVFSESYRRQLYGNYCSTDDIQNVFDLYTVSHPKGLSAHTIKDYQAAVNWALKCKDNLKIGDITSTFVKKLVGMLDRDGKSINTRKIYLRSLKAIYRFAVKKNMVIDTKPFEAQSLTSTRKMNFGLTEEDFIKVIEYNGDNSEAQFARDMFLLLFHCNGHYMSDILRIKNKNIENGYVRFVREKTKDTGLEVCFLLTNEARKLFSKYGKIDPDSPEDYVLPYLIGKSEEQIQSKVHDMNKRVRKGLSVLCSELGMAKITTKQARHTYASIANSSKRSIQEIQADLGHTNIQTTIGYINRVSVSSLQSGKQMKDRFSTKH